MARVRKVDAAPERPGIAAQVEGPRLAKPQRGKIHFQGPQGMACGEANLVSRAVDVVVHLDDPRVCGRCLALRDEMKQKAASGRVPQAFLVGA